MHPCNPHTYQARNHQLRMSPLAAGFLEGLLDVHQLWTDSPGKIITANSFEDTFCAYLSVVTDLDSLSSLGVEGMGSGPFSDCAVCAPLPSGNVLSVPYLPARMHACMHARVGAQFVPDDPLCMVYMLMAMCSSTPCCRW
jgi:hypothetical protein